MEQKTYRRDIPDDEISRLKIMMHTTRDKAVEEHLEWQMESVKHLILLNGGGLAAAATVLAGSGNDAIRFSASYAASLCAVGLIFAISLMIWRWAATWTEFTRLAAFIRDFENNRVAVEDAIKLKSSRMVAVLTVFAATVSLCSFVCAMYLIFHTARTELVESSQSEPQPHVAYRFQLPGGDQATGERP